MSMVCTSMYGLQKYYVEIPSGIGTTDVLMYYVLYVDNVNEICLCMQYRCIQCVYVYMSMYIPYEGNANGRFCCCVELLIFTQKVVVIIILFPLLFTLLLPSRFFIYYCKKLICGRPTSREQDLILKIGILGKEQVELYNGMHTVFFKSRIYKLENEQIVMQ